MVDETVRFRLYFVVSGTIELLLVEHEWETAWIQFGLVGKNKIQLFVISSRRRDLDAKLAISAKRKYIFERIIFDWR